ncbi:MAG TPA: VOC family protein [Propionicimonas sp.]|jgi:pterin-4a-carbinolamine dehydratase|uniref:VOC family protein n=1 Tax=Propionicimonas sp. TaxID=1955623 RepID=UPI002F4216C9
MTDATLTPRQFQEADGTGEWRALNAGADAWFDAPSHRAGAALVRRVGELAELAGHHPDVDLRADGVHVRTYTHDTSSLTGRDVSLARSISAAAADLGLGANPAATQRMQVAIDVVDREAVVPFWQAALGFDRSGDDRLSDPLGRLPRVWFQEMGGPRPLRNRIHVDAGTPWELVGAKLAALEAAGGRVAYQNRWWQTVADAEGNEVDVFPLEAAHGVLEGDGTGDWRVMLTAATYYPISSFGQGVALVEAVAGLADDAGLPLLIDLRYPGVTVDSGKDQHEAAGFAALAVAVQSAARDLGLVADTTRIRDFQLGIDALDVAAVRAFWRVALGYVEDPRPDLTDLYDPRRLNPPVFFQQLDEPRPQRNRIHVDLFVPDDQAEARVAAAVAAGGTVVFDAYAPDWWTVADPEGNELDIAVTVGRAERESSRG